MREREDDGLESVAHLIGSTRERQALVYLSPPTDENPWGVTEPVPKSQAEGMRRAGR